jgi:hypothetical protein
MTTPNEAKEAIYARFVANFTGVTSDRIDFDNEDFNEPSSGSWVRLSVRTGPRLQNTMGKQGNRRFRTAATVFVQVYTQTNTGVQTGDTLAKAAADIFEGESFSGLDFSAVDVRETGPSGKWYQHVVEAPFDYDEIK